MSEIEIRRKRNWIVIQSVGIRIELSDEVRGEKGESFDLHVGDYTTANALLEACAPPDSVPSDDHVLHLVIHQDGNVRAALLKQAMGGKGDRVFIMGQPLRALVTGAPYVHVTRRQMSED